MRAIGETCGKLPTDRIIHGRRSELYTGFMQNMLHGAEIALVNVLFIPHNCSHKYQGARIIKEGIAGVDAIIGVPMKDRNKAKIPLDRISGRRGRGRPPQINPAIVRSYADRLRLTLDRGWDQLGEPLMGAQNEQEIANAIKNGLPDCEHELLRFAPLILKVRKAQRFPKKRKAQINFLADSIGAGGTVTPRRSRDICAKERAADANRHVILRYEYWIECSCGYKGRSENHRCRRCGAILYVPGDSVQESPQYV